MTARTRYFVVSSLVVLGLGVGGGFLAYYGLAAHGLFSSAVPDELRLLPRTATVVAYAEVADVMHSDIHERMRQAVGAGAQQSQQREFETATGINVETDIDRVVACLDPAAAGQSMAGLVVARGRFNDSKIEALMREHGAQVDTYKGIRIVNTQTPNGGSLAVAFVEPGLIAVGGAPLVRRAVDLRRDAGQSVAANDELMTHIRGVSDGNAWAVGRPEALAHNGRFGGPIAAQLPTIAWFAASGHIDSGVRGLVRAEALDDAAAANLRDVIRGFVALAKMQTGGKPEIQTALQSLELGGTGKTVDLSFDLPSAFFDALAANAKPGARHP